MFHTRHGLAAAAVIAAIVVSSCAKKAGGPGGPGGFQMPPTPVEVSSVHSQVVRDQFRALGSIEALETIEVVGELNAKVRSMPFTEGQPVGAGATLVQLDDREFRAAADRARAQRDQARANFNRAEKLSAQQMVSVEQLDDSRTNLKVAEANDALARAQLDKTRIRAPWAGMIGRRKVSPGAYIRSGDAIAELARIDEMKIAFGAPERYAGEIRTGAPIEITTPAYPGETFLGRVTIVDPIVDPNTRTVQLVARVANPGRRLRPGMSANVTVTLAERGSALVVPGEAVFAQGAENFVYVVKPDSTVARTAVELGARDSVNVEVTRGLADGAVVVRAGHQKLYDGAHVMPVSNLASFGAPAGAAGAGPAKTAASEPDPKDTKPTPAPAARAGTRSKTTPPKGHR